MKIIILLLLLSTIIHPIFNQDSIKLKHDITLEFKSQHNIPIFRNRLECIDCEFNKVPDNPFFHFAVYSGVINKFELNKKYVLETGIFMEQRSYSGGNSTLVNNLFFPKIKFSAMDTFSLKKLRCYYKVVGGDFWNENINDFLRIYNLDYQASQFEIGNNISGLGLLTIADLSKNIGFNLDEYYKLYFFWKNHFSILSFSYSINKYSQKTTSPHVISSDRLLSVYGKLNRMPIKIEYQIDLRINKILNTSFATGLTLEYKQNFNIIKFKTKYYQSDFNKGYLGTGPIFGTINNYVGTQLYPLKNYYRTNFQWANYVKYQNKNILGFELELNYKKHILNRLNLFFNCEISALLFGSKSLNEFIVVPYYQTGVEVDLLKKFRTNFFITNKHMYLLTYYQSFIASKYPFWGYSISLDLDNNK